MVALERHRAQHQKIKHAKHQQPRAVSRCATVNRIAITVWKDGKEMIPT